MLRKAGERGWRWLTCALVACLLLLTTSPGLARTPQAAVEGPSGQALPVPDVRDGDDLLDFCVKNPEACAISVYDIGAGVMAHQFPDRPQALASTSKILFLLGYAQAVADGLIDPADRLSREEWARYLTLDGFALKTSWEDLGKPDNPTWNDLARMMILHSDNSTPDHLYAVLGKKRLKNARKLFKGFHDIPLPISAIIGLWKDGGGVGGEASRIADSYGSIGTRGFRDEGKSLFDSLSKSGPLATYRKSLCVSPPWESPGPCALPTPAATIAQLQFLTRNHFTRSTTRAYMTLMAALLRDDILTQEVRDIVQPILEIWLEEFPSLMPAFSRYGLKGGSLSGGGTLDVLTWAHYMRTGTGGEYVVVVFLQAMADSPTPPDVGDVNSFAQLFALDSAFRARVLNALESDDDRAELVPEILKLNSSGKARTAAKITVKVRVENAGPTAAKSSVLRVYLSDDNVLDDGDALIGEATIAKLKGYKGKNAKITGSVPGSAKDMFVIVAADADAANKEQDETNNLLWQRLR
jgi:hypothetical protein